MTIKLTLQGLSEAVGTIKQIPPELERRVILDLSQVAYESAYAGAASHSKTGVLLQSLFNRAVPNGRAVGHDIDRAPQALWVNLGTRPHDIRPRNKKSLRWASGGQFIFAKLVKHPGYAGDAYVIRSATDALRQFSAIVDAAMKEAK